MNREQIESWVKRGESETLEFKRTTGERKEAAMAVCAMLNARGGKVLFGVEPSGKIIGQDVSDKTIEDVAFELGRIDPPVFPAVDRVPVGNNKEVLVISVSSGEGRPYSYKGESVKRVGNTNQIMSREEYNRMLMERLHVHKRWENELADDWMVDDLDHELILDTLTDGIRLGRVADPKTREPLEILRGFGLVKGDKLLRAAVVLFGKNEKVIRDLPQLLLKVATFRGTDKGEFIDNRQFHGNAFYLFQMAQKFFMESIPIAGKIVPEQFRRIDRPLYPPIALREAVANAICHRDYTIGGGSISIAIYRDRLEIVSPGPLHFGITPEDLFKPHESKPWNPLIASVFYRRGIIETWGRGTLKIFEESREAGLSDPMITERSGDVMVTFIAPGIEVKSPVEVNIQDRILQLLKQSKDGVAIRDLMEKITDLNRNQLKYELGLMRQKGLIDYEGRGAGTRWRVL